MTSKRNRNRTSHSKQVSEVGIYLSIVFEFLGMLGFSGLVAYALQRWIWPEATALIFPVVMMAGLAIGIYQIVLRSKAVERDRLTSKDPEIEEKPATMDDSYRALDDLRKLNDRLEEIRRKKK